MNYTGTFVISFDEMMVAPSGKELKILLLEIMQAFNSTGQDATNIKETNYERSFAQSRKPITSVYRRSFTLSMMT